MKTVGLVLEQGGTRGLPRVFQLLERVFPVRFDLRTPGDYDLLDGLIAVGEESSLRVGQQRADLPSLLLQNDSHTSLHAITGPVDFGSNDFVPAVFRRKSVAFSTEMKVCHVTPRNGDEVLASIAGRPIWVASQEGGHRTDVAGIALPEVREEDRLTAHFNEANFFRLLPLVEYLRRISGQKAWTQPPIRACFMFDDPNLRLLHYGYLDYRQLAREASQHNYHVAFATIPLDAWLVNRRVSSFLIKQKRWLSLLIHGNDHAQDELALPASDEDRLRRLAQALRRMERLEERTGVEVSRVMAAPYGACNAEALRDMARLGYEAICITTGSLWAWNQERAWADALGLKTGEIIEGLPVIPRFGLRRGCTRTILLAAYLGQAIVLVGHHQDVSNGLDLLAELAAYVNSLGDVSWGNLRSISRSNFEILHQGDVLRLKMYTRLVELQIPIGVRTLAIDRPWAESINESLVVNADYQPTMEETGAEPRFPVGEGKKVVVRSIPVDLADINGLPSPNVRLWPAIRRQLAECRDRTAPLLRLPVGESWKS
jgi:hypothetical protein